METLPENASQGTEKTAPKSNEEKMKCFECKVCMEIAEEPIVTQCGHLYCWQCIYDWACTKSSKQVPCPICKNSINVDEVIPLYTSNDNHKKRTESLPKRPKPHHRTHEGGRTSANAGASNNFNATFFLNGIPVNMSYQGIRDFFTQNSPFYICMWLLFIAFYFFSIFPMSYTSYTYTPYNYNHSDSHYYHRNQNQQQGRRSQSRSSNSRSRQYRQAYHTPITSGYDGLTGYGIYFVVIVIFTLSFIVDNRFRNQNRA